LKRSSIDHALLIAKHSKPTPPLVIRKARKADGGGVGGSLVTAMRDAGMKRIDDLIRDALLNPELARKLLAKGPESGSKSRQIAIAQYLRRNSAAALFNQTAGENDRK
jgi:hypothetical protein